MISQESKVVTSQVVVAIGWALCGVPPCLVSTRMTVYNEPTNLSASCPSSAGPWQPPSPRVVSQGHSRGTPPHPPDGRAATRHQHDVRKDELVISSLHIINVQHIYVQ